MCPQWNNSNMYFREGLRPSIWAQLNYWGQDLNAWEEMVKKVGDIETKANLQTLSYVQEINFRSPKSYRPLSKNDKEDTQWKHHNEMLKEKAKSQISSITNQPQT